ncbi:UNVERIFIED_CONTAM: putative Flp pilus-assembly TadE/G-like protein [Acetivibrio alkalicellulosi]
MKIIKTLHKNEQGSILVLMSFFIVIFCLFMAVFFDAGFLYMQKSRVQKIANVAALSGIQVIDDGVDAVENVIEHIVREHGENLSDENSSITIVININDDEVDVTLSKEISLGLSRLIVNQGSKTIDVNAKAKNGGHGAILIE